MPTAASSPRRQCALILCTNFYLLKKCGLDFNFLRFFAGANIFGATSFKNVRNMLSRLKVKITIWLLDSQYNLRVDEWFIEVHIFSFENQDSFTIICRVLKSPGQFVNPTIYSHQDWLYIAILKQSRIVPLFLKGLGESLTWLPFCNRNSFAQAEPTNKWIHFKNVTFS